MTQEFELELMEMESVISIEKCIYKSCQIIHQTISSQSSDYWQTNLKTSNKSGDMMKRIDEKAHQILWNNLSNNLNVGGIISEEHPTIKSITRKTNKPKYIVAFDPIDGSINIKYGVTTGTIYGIYKSDTLELVASGYFLYDLHQTFVTTNILTKKVILNNSQELSKIKEIGDCYSYNSGKINNNILITKMGKHSCRYVGTMVVDVHRTILDGGLFIYPDNNKLRLYYEILPLGLIVKHLDGEISNFKEIISSWKLNLNDIHETSAVLLGSRLDVKKLMS